MYCAAVAAYCKLQGYIAFDNVVISNLYALLRATIIEAKSVSLLKMNANKQSLATIMGRMSVAAMDRPN
jgi:hypothetical protein